MWFAGCRKRELSEQNRSPKGASLKRFVHPRSSGLPVSFPLLCASYEAQPSVPSHIYSQRTLRQRASCNYSTLDTGPASISNGGARVIKIFQTNTRFSGKNASGKRAANSANNRPATMAYRGVPPAPRRTGSNIAASPFLNNFSGGGQPRRSSLTPGEARQLAQAGRINQSTFRSVSSGASSGYPNQSVTVNFTMSGSLGLSFVESPAGWAVIQAAPAGQASGKDIRAGDIIFAVNDTQFRGRDYNEAVRRIKSSVRPLRITFARPSDRPEKLRFYGADAGEDEGGDGILDAVARGARRVGTIVGEAAKAIPGPPPPRGGGGGGSVSCC